MIQFLKLLRCNYMKIQNNLLLMLILLTPIIIFSAISPKSYITWFFESLPLFIGLIILIKTYKNFSFSGFAYSVIFIGGVLILIGAHYTYAEVPLFHWIRDGFGFERNNYDKLGHFFQGFITAVLAKELLIGKKVLASKFWLNLFVLSFSVALSAFWEILEWFVFDISTYFSLNKTASEFLGTQGYFWDAQSDILFATFGAIIIISIFSKYHEKFIKF